MNYLLRILLVFTLMALGAVLLSSCSESPTSAVDSMIPSKPILSEGVTLYSFKVINEFPHDRQAFTQGLVFDNGVLYEGTGLRGQSTLRRVDLWTGNVTKVENLEASFFGEGITVYEDEIIQLTWTSNVGFVYDKNSFEFLQEFGYPTQGWGITHDGEHLIMSDGTSNLYFLDPQTFTKTSQIEVFDDNGPVHSLNELEYIEGKVFANVWLTDRIAVIDPASGRVTSWIDLEGLLSAEDRGQPVNVLNGIAFDSENARLFVTGKLWPKLFEIELVAQN